MTSEMVMEISRNSLVTALVVAGPILGVALVIGLAISVFQAVTQINEATLTFVPKIIAIFMAMALFGSWMMSTLVSYTTGMFAFLPYMTR